ncbi:MAG TPA: serine hydrolase [Mucilaginibacter sp.]|nr:serine hydrolase [Mucilaginibacter sp.]
MYKFIASLYLSMISLMCIAQSQPNARLTKSIDSLVAPQFAGNQPGVSILVAKKGQIVYEKAFGSANIELNVPARPDMTFDLGSITKQFTAVAILQLAEKGKISLQDSIQKYIKNFPSKGYKISIENLLTHTSGIPDYMQLNVSDPYLVRKDFSPEAVIDSFKNLPLEFEPGTKFSYSNSGYFLLGYIIRQVTGESYGKYIQDNIISPLGLNHTFYNWPNQIIPGHVNGYKIVDGQYQKADFWSATLPYAAGDLVSNVGDLLKWHQALYAGKVLKKQTLEKAFTPFVLKDGTSTGYGYGWGINNFSGVLSIGHGGAITGFRTSEQYYPQEDVYVAILGNCDCTPVDELSVSVSSIALRKSLQPDVTVSKAILDGYVGTYSMVQDQKRTMSITREGDHLVANLPGQGSYELLFQSDTAFSFKGVTPHADAHFFLENGKVTGFIVQQNGQYEWEKIK